MKLEAVHTKGTDASAAKQIQTVSVGKLWITLPGERAKSYRCFARRYK
jgi:hypothetical protein